MINVKKTDILYSVTNKLYSQYPDIPIYALNHVESIKENAFYVNILTVSRESEAYRYIEKRFTIDVMYKCKKNDNPEIYYQFEDEILDTVFTDYLDIDNREELIRNRKPRIFAQDAEVEDNVLHCMFDIMFTDNVLYIEDYELMEDLRLKYEFVEKIENPFL